MKALLESKELLALSDAELLAHPRVVAAYRAMMGKTQSRNHRFIGCSNVCEKCGVMVDRLPYPICINPIPGCIEKVAFEMRDACVEKYWYSHLFFLSNFYDGEDAIKRSTAKQWIIAAMQAWEGIK